MDRLSMDSKSSFEDIRFGDSESAEIWLARDIMPLLDYATWENFVKVIDKAKTACKESGSEVDDHFRDITKVITAGKGAQHEISDIALTRYACYLVAQNSTFPVPAK